MITVSNDIKGLVALIIIVVLYEIVCWGVKGIIKDIKKLKELKSSY